METKDTRNVFQRMNAVMQKVKYLCKDDKVEFKATKYKAISEEKVTTAVRNAMVEEGLVIFPVEQHRERVGQITSVDTTYRLQNIDNPDDYIFVVSSGDGADTQDKGAGKAMTYAFKYALLRTFAIPTGEDPDKISSAELDAQEEQRKIAEAEKQKEMEKAFQREQFEKSLSRVKKLLLEINSGNVDVARKEYAKLYDQERLENQYAVNDVIKHLLEIKNGENNA